LLNAINEAAEIPPNTTAEEEESAGDAGGAAIGHSVGVSSSLFP